MASRNIVTAQTINQKSNVVRYGNHWYWAEHGQIHVEDQETGSAETLSVYATLLRLRSEQEQLNYIYRNDVPNGLADPSFVRRKQTWLEQMVELCRIAREQGDPYDPSVRRRRRRALRERRNGMPIGNRDAITAAAEAKLASPPSLVLTDSTGAASKPITHDRGHAHAFDRKH